MLLASKILQSKIQKILNVEKSNYFTLNCKIKSFDDDKLSVDVSFIDNITIDESFYKNYADKIDMFVQMKPIDLMNLLEFKTSLYCAIRFDYIDMESGDLILDEDPEIYYFRIFIKNTDDIYKKYHISAITKYHEEEVPDIVSHEGTLIPVAFQLIENTAYDLHRQQLTGMYTNVTIEEMLKYISKNFGISVLNLYPPDNKVKYKHFFIPPEYAKFDRIYNYIQERYGVYNKGLNYYFYQGVFYIYPAYDTHIKRKTSINIYRGPANSYLGLKNYFTEEISGDNKIINLVCTSKLKNIKLNEIGLEEIGTNLVFLRSDMMIDKSRILSNDKFIINEKNNITVSASDKSSVSKNAAIPTYVSPTMNIFQKASILEQSNAEMVILDWPLSRPFRLIPGTEVNFFYDKEEIENRRGIVESINYNIMKQEHSTSTPTYSISAMIAIRIEIKNK